MKNRDQTLQCRVTILHFLRIEDFTHRCHVQDSVSICDKNRKRETELKRSLALLSIAVCSKFLSLLNVVLANCGLLKQSSCYIDIVNF